MIFASLDEYDPGGPMVRTIWGHDISVESAEDDLQRLEDKIDVHVAELNKQHDTATRRRLRARLDALDREHSSLFRQLNPPSLNESDGFENVPNNDAIRPCRSTSCGNSITKSLSFRTGGWCPPCFRIATKTSNERAT